MNEIVNFEIAKLLLDKGFNEYNNRAYHLKEQKGFYNVGDVKVSLTYEEFISSKFVVAPTIAQIIMYLYKKHDIWIWVEKYSTMFRPYVEKTGDERFGKWEKYKYNSPIEAYKSAIEYTLKNLIK